MGTLGWVEHFQAVLNQYSKFDTYVMDALPQWPTGNRHLDEVPTPEEVSPLMLSSTEAPVRSVHANMV